MTTDATPLRMRLSSPDERLRVLLLTNEDSTGHAPGWRDAFSRLMTDGSIAEYSLAAPRALAASKGELGAQREIVDLVREKRPNVIVLATPAGFPLPEEWFQAIAAAPSHPLLLFWEGDAWGRWSKPVTPEVRRCWRAADVVFTVAFGKQRDLIERVGGRDVRFVPFTYDHVRYAAEEESEPSLDGDHSEVAVIGNWWGNRYFISRLRGARARFRLVQGLQRDPDIPLAIYGRNWVGRGVRGPIPIGEQAAVARRALLTANWDHYPDYAAFYSDRLAIALLAGRAHVTTLHPASEWLPGPETGLFLEPSVENAIRRVQELLRRPREEVLELGLAAHRWVRHRLSDRELARYILGAVDERLLRDLPADPWSRLPR